MIKLSRRCALIGLAGGLGLSSLARADDLEKWQPLLTEVLSRRWTGTATTPVSGQDYDVLELDLVFNFTYEHGILSGDYKIQSSWADASYTAFFSIDGGCWERDGHVGVHLDNTHMLSGDELPEGMYWQGLTGELEFFNDQNSAGNFLLAGTLTGTVDYAAFTVSIDA